MDKLIRRQVVVICFHFSIFEPLETTQVLEGDTAPLL